MLPCVYCCPPLQYDGDLKLPTNYLVPPPAISGTSGELPRRLPSSRSALVLRARRPVPEVASLLHHVGL